MLVRTTLRKLSNVKVSHVSLVERGANRIPFRIIKSEKPEESAVGLDLSKRFKQDKPAAAEVLGVITFDRGDAEMSKVSEALTAAGFSVAKAEKQDDGTIYFEQAPAVDGEETHIVRLSDQMAVVVKGLVSYASDLGEGSFSDKVQAQGYFEGMRTCTNVFTQELYKLMYDRDTSDTASAVAKVQALVEDFGNYAMAMTSALPATVFKADNAICALEVAKAETEVETTTETPTPKVENTVDKNTETEVTKGDATVDDAAATKAKAEQDAAAAKGIADIVKAALEPVLAPMTSALGAITESLKAITAKQETMDGELKAATAKAEKAEKAVTTTTTAPSQGDPVQPAKAAVAKGEDTHVELFDTAYSPRKRS